MRNMSFRLTTEQIGNRAKTVTRRVGWKFLTVGNLIQAVEKGQGLKKGEKVRKLAVLRVERVSQEWMSDFRQRADAQEECRREGFPEMTPEEFYVFFRRSHPDPSADDLLVTRIEFSYVEPDQVEELERIDKEVTALNKWGDRLIASGAVKFIEF